MRGSAWTIGGHAASQILRFANNITLTYLIAPDLLGLIGIVHVLLAGLHQLSDFGVGPAIIQNSGGDEQSFRDTAWTLHIVRGAILWALTFPLGPLLAWFYANEPGAEQLTWLVPVVGLSALLTGLHSMAPYALNRQLRLRPLVMLDVGTQLLGCGVGIVWAVLDPGLAALIAAVLVAQVVYTIGSHCLGIECHLRWDPSAAAVLVRFGRWVWMSTTLTWITSAIDRLLMPTMVSFDGLAIYQVALMVAAAGPEVAHLLGSRVLFPALSALLRRGDPAFHDKLLRARIALLLPTVSGLLLLSLCGEWLIHLIYPAAFDDAGWMLRLLAAAAIPQMLIASSWYVFLALGFPAVMMGLQAAKLLLKGSAMLLGNHLGGPYGVIVGLVVAEALHYPFVAIALHKCGILQLRLDLPVVIVSGAVLGLGFALW
ncbi:MAG TPA: oligosaccharide flippase family protein [Planctomycetota bacterium]